MSGTSHMPVDAGLHKRGIVIFGRFSNVDNFRPERDNDVISGLAIDRTGVQVRVKLGDSRSNNFGAMHVFTDRQTDRRAPFS